MNPRQSPTQRNSHQALTTWKLQLETKSCQFYGYKLQGLLHRRFRVLHPTGLVAVDLGFMQWSMSFGSRICGLLWCVPFHLNDLTQPPMATLVFLSNFTFFKESHPSHLRGLSLRHPSTWEMCSACCRDVFPANIIPGSTHQALTWPRCTSHLAYPHFLRRRDLSPFSFCCNTAACDCLQNNSHIFLSLHFCGLFVWISITSR